MKINWNHLIAFIWALLISLLWLFTMYSCSIEHHLSKAQKHLDIAKRKGAVITPDTVWQYNYTKETIFDTITQTYKEILKKDSTLQTINNVISAGMTRQERLALEANFKHLEKMMKLQNDSLNKQLKAATKINGQNQKTIKTIERLENKPWMWVAISLVALVFLVGLFMVWRFFKF
jgi:uncharacterized membrane protein YdbT with pleckstrin-like domain